VNRAALTAICTLVLLAPSLAAEVGQGAGSATPQGQTQPPKSTALITGRVVDGATGEPIAEAVVALIPPGGRGAGRGLPPGGGSPEVQQAMEAAMAAAAAAAGRGGTGQQRVMTGADGRFVFHSLPPGNFQLSATLTGYTSSLGVSLSPSLIGAAGGVSATPSSTTLPMKEGEFATGVTLRLWKFGVISGTVFDDAGEPAIGLVVQVARRLMAAGRVRYVPAWSARTDDRGAYRISSIVPGDYLVVVPQAQVSMPTTIMSGLLDIATSGTPMANGGAGMALMDLMSSGVMPTEAMTGGVRIGDFMVASSGSVPLIGPEGRLMAYQTTFFPGAAVPAQASLVTLKSGDERSDVNFQLRLIPTSRVSGRAVGPDGPLGNLGIRLVVPGDGVVSESEFDVATAITKPDGTFAFFGVPPGQFLLKAQKQPRPELPAEALAGNPAAAAMFGPGAGPPGPKVAMYAAAPISVSAGDADGIVLQLSLGFRISGRLEFESATGRPAPPAAQIQSATVNLVPQDGRMPSMIMMAVPDRANAQGEFQTKGNESGKYFLNVTGAGPWQLKSATIGGRDVLDAPIELRDADITGVVVTFTDKIGQVTGSVRSPAETDLSETSVVLFPADYRTWIDNGMNPRRSRTVRATKPGAFTIPNVPAGDYLIVAIDRSAPADLQDPANVESLSRGATRVSVAADPVTVNLDKTRVVR
jgi:hypothetical protein